MKRRKFLSILGGGVIVAAAASTATVASRQPKTALLPWTKAGAGYADLRKRVLSWAILAPNPHNRQPWLVDLRSEDRATLYVDVDRMLPHTDPFNRQITVGLGCFLELARMAAAQEGFAMHIELFPDGSDPTALDRRPIAILRFEPGANADPLFAHAVDRRTLKEPFDLSRPVSSANLDKLLKAAQHTALDGSVAGEHVEELRTLTREALRIEMETPRTYLESVDLFRVGAKEVDANPDGIDFTGPMFELLAAAGMMRREALIDTTSAAYAEGIKAVFAHADTAMGHLWQVTKTNTREDQIAAGRDWLRINLAATGQGIGLQPLSQALQEYDEMKGLYTDIHAKLAPDGGTIQMLARIGYADTVAVSPRWPLETRLI